MSLEGKTQEEIAALAELSDSVLSNKKTAHVYQRLIKEANPGVSMPLVELEDRAVATFGAQAKQIAELNGKLAQTEAEKGANMLFEELRDEGFVTTRNSFNDLVKYASESGFQTTKAGLSRAAMQRRLEQEPAEPTPQMTGHGAFSIGEGDDAKNFMRDPAGHARAVAAKAMDELRKSRSTKH